MCDPVFQAKRFAGIHVDAEADMLSITFITGFATVFGTAEGIRAAQAKSRREEHRSRKNNLLVHVPKSSQFSPLLEGRSVVLSGDRVSDTDILAFDYMLTSRCSSSSIPAQHMTNHSVIPLRATTYHIPTHGTPALSAASLTKHQS